MQNVRLTLLLFAVRTSTVVTALKKVTTITFTHKLSLSSLIKKVVHFLLSRINKLDRDFLYWKKIITCLSPEEQRDIAFIRMSP